MPATIQGPLEALKDRLKNSVFHIANKSLEVYKE
jgi:hypothetical protein